MEHRTSPLQPVRLAILVALSLLLTTGNGNPPDTSSPEWARAEMERTAGRWIADNSAYRSETEPFDAYGLEWTWTIGEKGLNGRLFGVINGEEKGTFWEFRLFWHPGEERLMLYQFGGDGTVGVGSIAAMGDDGSETVQTFYPPDGASYRVGHRTAYRDGKRHDRSFAIDSEGNWTKQRTYVWKRPG